MAETIGGELAGTVRGGSTTLANNPGKSAAGSGVNKVAGGPKVPPDQVHNLMQGIGGTPQRPPGKGPPQAPPPQAKRQFNNPPMMTQPPPVPHPGLMPPYPDARSPQPTMMPNGSTVMPPPTGFIQPNTPPRVPATFIPGMTGLLGRR